MSRRLPSLTALRAFEAAASKAYHLVTPLGRMHLDKVVVFRKRILSQLKR